MLTKLLKPVKQIGRLLGRRGGVLLIMGLIDIGVSMSLFMLTPELAAQPQYESLAAFLPLWIWGALWGLSGMVSIVQSVWRGDVLAYTVSATVKAMFGFQYLMAWLFAGADRGWVSATVWFLTSVLMVLISGWAEVTRIVLSPKSEDAVIGADSAGRITYWNSRAEEMFGYNSDEILGEKLTILMPTGYRSDHSAAIDRARETGRSEVAGRILLVEALHRDGSVFPVELVVSVSGDGDAMTLGGVIRSRRM